MKIMFRLAILCFFSLALLSCGYCGRYVYPENYKGVVTRKYIVKNNRNAHVLVIMENNERFSLETYADDTISLYSRVHIGDSVIKYTGSNSYRVKNHGRDFVYSINCL